MAVSEPALQTDRAEAVPVSPLALGGAHGAAHSGQGRVRVWFVEHAAVAAHWPAVLASLNQPDQVRVRAIRHPGRALSAAAGRYLGFRAERDGIACRSIAHEEGFSLCATAAEPLGADVTAVERAPWAQGWPDGFSAAEQTAIAAFPRHQAGIAFALAWAAKEALYKLGSSTGRFAGIPDLQAIDVLPLLAAAPAWTGAPAAALDTVLSTGRVTAWIPVICGRPHAVAVAMSR